MTKEELTKRIFDLGCAFHESLFDAVDLENITDVYIKETKPEIPGKFYPRAVMGFKYKK